MIRMVQGSTRIGLNLYSASSGAFETDAATEKRLVSLGVAVYVTERPRTSKETGAPATGKSKAGNNAPKGKNLAKGKQAAKNAASKKDAKPVPPPEDEEGTIEDGEQPPELGAEASVV